MDSFLEDKHAVVIEHIRIIALMKLIDEPHDLKAAFIDVKMDVPFLEYGVQVTQTLVSGYFSSMSFQAS